MRIRKLKSHIHIFLFKVLEYVSVSCKKIADIMDMWLKIEVSNSKPCNLTKAKIISGHRLIFVLAVIRPFLSVSQ